MATTEFSAFSFLDQSIGMCVVSVDNSRFSTKFFRNMADQIVPQFDKFWFFVADDLMVYNKLLSAGNARKFSENVSYYTERKSQIERVFRASSYTRRILVRSYGDVIDQSFIRFFRKFLVLVNSDPELLARVHERAEAFATSRGHGHSTEKRRAMTRNSIFYIIEESAWTIYLAATKRVTDNFYPGDISVLIRDFYNSAQVQAYAKVLRMQPHVHRIWNLDVDPMNWSQGLAFESFEIECSASGRQRSGLSKDGTKTPR